MILYVNGDSHSAGAEAVNNYCFAEDDRLYYGLGRKPHPDNERVSYGCHIANKLGAILHCDAESASSNDRIIRTTDDYVHQQGKPDLLIIGWSTWEREEWWDSDTKKFWQVNAGGIGSDWPNSIKAKYQEWILNLDYEKSINKSHNLIYHFHLWLQDEGVNHYFFTCFEPFKNVKKYDWDGCYLEPYDKHFTYYNWCMNQGFKTVRPNSYHFGANAHEAWAEFLYEKIVIKNLTQK